MQDKEMMAIIHCLCTCRHYLLGSRVCYHDRQCCNKLLPIAEEISTKQARRQDFLAEFDYKLQYKPGKANVLADALS